MKLGQTCAAATLFSGRGLCSKSKARTKEEEPKAVRIGRDVKTARRQVGRPRPGYVLYDACNCRKA